MQFFSGWRQWLPRIFKRHYSALHHTVEGWMQGLLVNFAYSALVIDHCTCLLHHVNKRSLSLLTERRLMNSFRINLFYHALQNLYVFRRRLFNDDARRHRKSLFSFFSLWARCKGLRYVRLFEELLYWLNQITVYVVVVVSHVLGHYKLRWSSAILM